MNILGIHIGHDSTAALVIDGKIVADVAEERFTRIKHYCGLPIKSVEYCLESQNLSMSDIDVIAVPSLGSVPRLNFLLDLDGRATRTIHIKKTDSGIFKSNNEKSDYKTPSLYKEFSSKKFYGDRSCGTSFSACRFCLLYKWYKGKTVDCYHGWGW